MVSREFRLRMEGYGLTTAEIHYQRPDHPSLLQLYVWQEYDLAPDFPTLRELLGFWEREVDRMVVLLPFGNNQSKRLCYSGCLWVLPSLATFTLAASTLGSNGLPIHRGPRRC